MIVLVLLNVLLGLVLVAGVVLVASGRRRSRLRASSIAEQDAAAPGPEVTDLAGVAPRGDEPSDEAVIEVVACGAPVGTLLDAVLAALAALGLAVESFTESRCLLAGPGGAEARLTLVPSAGLGEPHPAVRLVLELRRIGQDAVQGSLRAHLAELAPVLRIATPGIVVLGRHATDTLVVLDASGRGG